MNLTYIYIICMSAYLCIDNDKICKPYETHDVKNEKHQDET